MYLISATATYFKGQIAVSNLTEPNSSVGELLNVYIDERVRLLLQNLLGNVLFDDLDSNITNGVLDNDAPQKWKDFVNGVNYTIDGKTFVWGGVKELLAFFVYHEFKSDLLLKDDRIQPKNVTVTNPNSHLVSVWNQFLSMYQSGTICGCVRNYSYVLNNGYVSCLRYLLDKSTDFVDPNLYYFTNSPNSNSLGV